MKDNALFLRTLAVIKRDRNDGMRNDFLSKLTVFKIIREKLDEVHENILTALNSGFADFPDSKARTYWERSDIMTLATLDKRIEDDKHLVSGFIRELKKGAKFYEVSY